MLPWTSSSADPRFFSFFEGIAPVFGVIMVTAAKKKGVEFGILKSELKFFQKKTLGFLAAPSVFHAEVTIADP